MTGANGHLKKSRTRSSSNECDRSMSACRGKQRLKRLHQSKTSSLTMSSSAFSPENFNFDNGKENILKSDDLKALFFQDVIPENLRPPVSSTRNVQHIVKPLYARIGPNEERENDARKLSQRQKQIDFGKNTIGYETYVTELPKALRQATDIWTPEKAKKCSKRAWDGQIKSWRRRLHQYDPNHVSSNSGNDEVIDEMDVD